MLNVFNRIVVVLLLAVMVLCTTLSAIAVWAPTVAPNLLAGLGQQTSALIAAASTLTRQTQAIVSIVAVVLLFITAILLILELRPPAGEQMIPVQSAEGGGTKMAASAVTQRLHHAIDRLDDVVEVTPRIWGRGDVVDVRLDVRTAPEIDVPMKDNEIKQVARNVVEGQMGLRIRKLEVQIDHAPFEEFA